MEILITECMYPTFHRFGIGRALGSNLAEPGEPRPRPIPTPTTTPLSGWVLTFAVWAKPSALLARGCRPRSGAHAFGLQASQGCTPFRSDGVQCLATLKHCTPSDLHYAAALLRFRPHFCTPSVG